MLVGADVVPGNWQAATRTFVHRGNPLDALKVATRRSTANSDRVGLSFAAVFGMDNTDVAASSIALVAVDGGDCFDPVTRKGQASGAALTSWPYTNHRIIFWG